MTLPGRLLAVALAACSLSWPAHAIPRPIRLYEISAVRFSVDGLGNRWIERGLLDSLGRFQGQSVSPVFESVTLPPVILNRTVITVEAWLAYGNLGSEAVGNFLIDEQQGMIRVSQRDYYLVEVAPEPKLDLGDAVNFSTRGRVAPGEEPLIGGFVVENQHRWVLIRGVGPGLARFGVPQPVADPHIVIFKNGSTQFQFFNDNWGERPDADRIAEVAASVGAFTLDRDSKDAAYLIELEPGAYTVHLSTDGAGGTGLIEIYVVP
ncbi:MAG: hypothetical protein IAE82_00720 [Opitutaceae bacterium]|nr:hypothetical protein [Opitutaceae bacterium]